MLYIQESLGNNEEILSLGDFHWMHEVRAVFNIFFGIVMAMIVMFGGVLLFYKLGRIPPQMNFQQAIGYLPLTLKIFAFMMFIIGIQSFARMMVEKATTEMAVTNMRIIYKKGLLNRRVAEISVDRVEGVVVLQSVLGRIFDYGQVIVRGMGVGEVRLPAIKKPIEFRKAVQDAREGSVNSNGDQLMTNTTHRNAKNAI